MLYDSLTNSLDSKRGVVIFNDLQRQYKDGHSTGSAPWLSVKSVAEIGSRFDSGLCPHRMQCATGGSKI